MGVKRAMDCVIREARKCNGPLYTLGPLIHNRQAVDALERRGVRSINSIEGVTEGTVVIRAHGIPPAERKKLEDAGLRVVDATCPHVRFSQNIVRRRHEAGRSIVIAGDKDHAEVAGLLGFCDNAGVVVSTCEEAGKLRLDGQVCLVAQTTFNEEQFGRIAEIIKTSHPDVEVVDTICRSTEQRQREVVELCKSVDAMVVVGGKHSANTRRLAEIARATGTPTVHVETAAELPAEFAGYDAVGVTAGASTPNWITAAVIHRLQEMSDHRAAPMRAFHRALRFLTTSTVYTGLGAVGLTLAAFGLQHGAVLPDPLFLIIAFCYIFSVHIWNRMEARHHGTSSMPPRAALYARHHVLSIAITLALAGLSLALALYMGRSEAALLLAAYLVGLAYNLPLAPLGLRNIRLKDLPASKDIFTATGWVAVAVVIPAISQSSGPWKPLLASVVAFILAFVRSSLFDFTDIQGDRLLGRETLPVLIGSHRTRILLAALSGFLALLLTAGTASAVFSVLGYWLLPCPIFIVLLLFPLFQRVVKSELVCPLVADGLLIGAGIAALALRMWAGTG